VHDHHREAIERLRRHFVDDPRYPALILGGSLVKGTARPDSDVDTLLIATDEEYERCGRERDHWFLSGDFTDYEGGYVEGKIVDLAFLHDVAERGSETARAAFVGARVLYSRIPEVEELVRRIPSYPEAKAQERIESFYVQVRLLRWFIDEAEKRADRYLLLRSAADMALFAGRLVLADNRILFPYHKWFMREVRNAPHKPDGICERVDALLERPSGENAQRLDECVVAAYDPGLSWTQIATRFMTDREWSWRYGSPPLEDW
jgi:hypothetical protein